MNMDDFRPGQCAHVAMIPAGTRMTHRAFVEIVDTWIERGGLPLPEQLVRHIADEYTPVEGIPLENPQL